MVKKVALALVMCTVLPGTASAATLMVSPVPAGEVAVSVDYAVNQVRYQVPTDSFAISRDTLAVSWLYESFYATLGSIIHTDFDQTLALEDFPLSGESGYLLATGVRGAMWRAGDFAINGHLQLHSLNEEVVADGVRRSLKSQEILAGVTAAWAPPRWRVYSGLEALPYSHIETALPGFEEIKRDEFFSVHVGGGVDLGPLTLSADFQFIGTEGVRVGLEYAF